MKSRFLVVIASLMAASSLYGQAPQTAKPPASASKAWTQTKLPWGDPDIQGTWTSDDYIGVPLQRNADIGTRLQRNEQEISAAQTNIPRTGDRKAKEFQAPNAAISVIPPGYWGEGARRPAQKTSMIIV